ncbi:hypothetical protein MSG28_008896 [Choristoneura fumiferana]|uniref:Uncharacterized protein n=1 Tax=Choristoneura fumiferana TaxID=7141 RepID=A0ACC0J8D6_CHOFU|nr:hypothetical protein MSG28_008896 [Choristoneura fumiferana]
MHATLPALSAEYRRNGACAPSSRPRLSDFVHLCDIDPLRFDADRPFLYLLIARQIPLFIGVYRGSEYAQATAPANKRKRFA